MPLLQKFETQILFVLEYPVWQHLEERLFLIRFIASYPLNVRRAVLGGCIAKMGRGGKVRNPRSPHLLYHVYL